MLPKVSNIHETNVAVKSNMWESGIEKYVSIDLPDCGIPVIGSALSEVAARQNAKKKLLRHASEAVLADHHSRRLFVGTDKGHVFIVEWRYGQMGYTMCGPDRDHASRASSAWTFEEAVEALKKHIATADFGSIVWEHS